MTEDPEEYRRRGYGSKKRSTLLVPNISNLQLWVFYRVKSKNKLKELVRYFLNQSVIVQ